jgi:threonine dehydrogenase-like Zn-dependent dehydrogenase
VTAEAVSRALRLVAPRVLALVPAPPLAPAAGEVRLRAVCSAISHGTELHLVRGTSPFAGRSFDADLRRFLPGPGAPVPPDGAVGAPVPPDGAVGATVPADGAVGATVPPDGPPDGPTGAAVPPIRDATPDDVRTALLAADGLPGAELGYELVGEVVATGPGVDVALGTLVHAPVGHAEEVTVPLGPELAIGYPAQPLPAGMPAETGTFVSLTAVALLAVHDARIDLGDEVVVSGLGTIGLLAVQLARASGARTVLGVDPIPARRELARRLGADEVLDPGVDPAPGVPGVPGDAGDPADPHWPEELASRIKRLTGRSGAAAGVDVVVETSGAPAALHQAIASVRVTGTVVSVGFVQGGAGALRLGEEWHHNRPQLVSSMGVWGCPHRAHPRWDRRRIAATALRLLADGVVDPAPLLGPQVPFERAAEAYALVERDPGAAAKVLLTYR